MKLKDYKNTHKSKVIDNVIKTIDSFNMVQKGDRILISVSGGPDSVFLTYIFYYLKKDLDLTILGFHLDHLTRNGQSTKDALFVERLYKKLSIELIKKKLDVGKWCRQKKLTFQEGARKLRIELLIEACKKNNIDKIALGHNTDDNIETFLMRLIRGAGSRGLSGMQPVRDKFIRPLINTPRKDIINYLEENDIRYCIDKTNLENIYFRNKIRNSLIPFIKENFLKKFDKNLIKSIELLRAENDFIINYSENKLIQIAYFNKEPGKNYINFIKVPVLEISSMPDAVRRRVILSGIEKIKGNLIDISSSNINDILKICRMGGGRKEINISKNIVLIKDYRDIYIFNINRLDKLPKELKALLCEKKKVEEGSTSGKQLEVGIGKRIKSEEFGIEIFSEVLDAYKTRVDFNLIKSMEAFVDYDKIKFPVKVKRWASGDRFFPLGMKKEKKLHDFFIDCKVSRNYRRQVPIFIDREKIIWIGNYRIDERVKINESTKKVLHIKLFKN